MATSMYGEVASGFDQAKITCYNILKTYFPNVDKSRSTLVNAFVSAMAVLYSMFQVFGRLLQAEVYVSEAQQLESLYKLVPFVGISLDQPTTLKTECSVTPQNSAITTDTEPAMYIRGSDKFTDASGNTFYLDTTTNLSKKVFELSATKVFYHSTLSGRRLDLSLATMGGEEFLPLSLYDTDIVSVEVPYRVTATSEIKKLKIKFDRSHTGYVGTPQDNGSDAIADVTLTGCYLHNVCGYISLFLAAGNTFYHIL